MNSLSNAELKLRNGAIVPLFCKYAIPSVITLLFVGAQTIIDGIVLGNYVGANALASVSLILPCYSFISAVAIVIGVGCQTLISIRLGEQNKQGANDALRSAFIFLVFLSITISIIAYSFATEIAQLLGANSVLLVDSITYLRALIPFFPLIVMMFFSDYVIKSTGRTIYAMVVMSSIIVINIVLDILFVGFYGMGTMGAGLATGIAFTVGAICNLLIVFKKNGIVSIRKGKFYWHLIYKMFYNGSSEGISELSSGITTLLFNLALMHYLGESGVAAFTAINYVFFIGVIIFLGISDGIIPIVSYNFGANQWERIKQVFFLAIKSNLIIGIIIFILLTLFGEEIISLFFRSGEIDVLQIASKGTSIYAFAFLLNGFNILSASYFTAMADAKTSIIISLLRGFVFVVIGIYSLPYLFGIEGIWYAVPIAETGTFFVSVYLIRRSFKSRKTQAISSLNDF